MKRVSAPSFLRPQSNEFICNSTITLGFVYSIRKETKYSKTRVVYLYDLFIIKDVDTK